jgi:hypothetical protein
MDVVAYAPLITTPVIFFRDGELSIDNNLSERSLRAQAVGRKNYMFVGSDRGGRTAATLYSLVASCKRHQVDPFAYLKDGPGAVADAPRNGAQRTIARRLVGGASWLATPNRFARREISAIARVLERGNPRTPTIREGADAGWGFRPSPLVKARGAVRLVRGGWIQIGWMRRSERPYRLSWPRSPRIRWVGGTLR